MRTKGPLGRRRRRLIVGTLLVGASSMLVAGMGASTAAAGTFVLHQCGGVKPQKGGFQPAEPHGGTFQVVDKCPDGGSAPALEVAQVSGASNERRGFWYLSARHSSLRFTRVAARIKLVSGSNSRARLVATNLDPNVGSNGTDWGMAIAGSGDFGDDWTNISEGGLNHSHLKLGIQCFAETCRLKDGSAGNPVQVAKGRNFEITVRDSGEPGVAASGPLLIDGSLIKGLQSGTVQASDPGAGVEYVETRVNGSVIYRASNACRDVVNGVAITQAPCAGTQSSPVEADTSLSPWQYGANSVEVCAYDYRTAGTANSACTAGTVRVDNRPDGPTSLDGAPSGWINDKSKLAVQVGVPNSVAPLTRLHYRLTGPDGYERTGAKQSGFASIGGADLPELGSPGTYTLRVWFEDSLGNVSEGGTGRSADFRYDPIRPEAAVLEQHDGWISSYDFDPAFVQTWSRPANDGAYPSGLRGYAVAITPDPSRDPCEGGPTPDCDDEEINHGPGSQSLRIGPLDRPDGRYYINTVPVTNAGNRGPRSQAQLFIDRTNADLEVSGLPSGWSRRPVTVAVTATDNLSGMSLRSPSEMPDGPPVTAIRIGAGAYRIAEGDRISETISVDGVHELSYYARDVAGNRNDGSVEPSTGYRFGAPETAVVRIDQTPPTGTFSRPAKSDPTLQRIAVSDVTSGVASALIQLRRKGTGEWTNLETSQRGGEFVARIDESEWESGTYEMRALATDVAGNNVALGHFADGSAAELALPLREATRATIDSTGTRRARGSGAAGWHRVGYAVRPVYRGALRDSDGDPIAKAPIKLRERFDAGSVVKERNLPALTDERGRYRVAGSRGPSRATRVVFAGDDRYRPVRSSYLRTLVQGRVRLTRYSRSVRAGRRAVFAGAIGRRGVKIPARGKIYEVQLLVPGEGWKTLDQAQRSRANGRFRFAYRFRPVERAVTFRMRIQVKRDPEWAYTQARSRKVSVTVRP